MTTRKEKQAIERIKAYDPMQYSDEPYYVGISGGKDSQVLQILMEMSGVKYELHHNHTTVDAPETVKFVRDIKDIHIHYPKTTMWELIVKNGIPPTRLTRYCCRELKETGGENRVCAFGVRWSESHSRKNQRGHVENQNGKESIILGNDNGANRRFLENCALKGKRVVNPIIDWHDSDVWYFLGHYHASPNPLYECGFDRVGCIGCPMAGKSRIKQFERYPKYKENYIKALDKTIKVWADKGKPRKHKTGEEWFDWWI